MRLSTVCAGEEGINKMYRTPATLAHEEVWNGKTYVVDGDNSIGSKQSACNERQELHAPEKQPGRRMHVRT